MLACELLCVCDCGDFVSIYVQCASVCVFVDAVRKLQDQTPRIVWEYALPHAVLPQRVSGSSSLFFHLPISSSGTLPRNFGLGKKTETSLPHTNSDPAFSALPNMGALYTHAASKFSLIFT